MKRTIWRKADDTVYVPRCSKCGKWRKDLMQHWFFTGIYCVSCIQDILYDNVRNISEVGK